ncbi:multidrug effflux MFS transporter [uncultured Acinetobacter sp.]|uniref:multidrug effflux MFS transporter n=1 Tax=uncultured Acinetobacter sp. TaxID=165433 RepID=UPI002629502B|nr:multidrug effflux MFS transporter [uncultured Acinetobacter sp.]
MLKPSPKAYPNSWILLLALLTALGPLSIDMYLPALPLMAEDFAVSTQRVANSLPAYFLGLAVGQLVYGPLSDRIGRKTPLYIGLALYILASLLCVFAYNEWSLIAARILQALGGCVGVVIARAAIRDRLDLQSSAQAFSSMMIVATIAPIMAPTLGAWVLLFFDWHMIFAFLTMMGIIAWLCVHFFFQETLVPERRLTLSFNQVLNLYAVIFKDRQFCFAMFSGCLSGGALFTYISGSAAVLMDTYGLNQQHFAYVFGCNALGIMVFSSLNKRFAQRYGILQRLKLGGAIQALGASILLLAGLVAAPLALVLLGLFLTVAGIGFTGPNAMALAMSEQGRRAGTASALMGSMQFGAGLLGGVLLNFLIWSPLMNMAIMMLVFIATANWSMRHIQLTQAA